MNNFKLNTDKQISFQSVGQTSKEYKIHPKTGSVWNKFRLPMSRRHW